MKCKVSPGSKINDGADGSGFPKSHGIEMKSIIKLFSACSSHMLKIYVPNKSWKYLR